MKILSVRQPWAWLIVHGHKDIENRSWSTPVRGPVLIHAGLVLPRSYYQDVAMHCRRAGIELPMINTLHRGGIVGMVDIVDCVRTHDSRWKDSDSFGFVLQSARPLPFTPMRGMLGFFDAPTDYLATIQPGIDAAQHPPTSSERK